MSISTADLSHNLLLPAAADTGNVRVILARQSPAGSTFQERGADVGRVKELPSVFIQFYKHVKKISHQKLILIFWYKTKLSLYI